MIGNLLAGMLNKGPVQGDFESIATTTVGAGGSATITFASIPSTYQHLQIRASVLSSASYIKINLNNDTAANYSWHEILGDGASATSGAGSSTAFGVIEQASGNVSLQPGVFVCDILDYGSTNKAKTIRSLGGFDNNGSGRVWLVSSRWGKTPLEAVNEIDLVLNNGQNFLQHSHFALYGIKG